MKKPIRFENNEASAFPEGLPPPLDIRCYTVTGPSLDTMPPEVRAFAMALLPPGAELVGVVANATNPGIRYRTPDGEYNLDATPGAAPVKVPPAVVNFQIYPLPRTD